MAPVRKVLSVSFSPASQLDQVALSSDKSSRKEVSKCLFQLTTKMFITVWSAFSMLQLLLIAPATSKNSLT